MLERTERNGEIIMKAYTDINQSKKLAEILSLESADMCYFNDGTATKIDANPYTVCCSMWKNCVVKIIPCWSLAALINILPDKVVIDGHRWGLSLGKKRISYLGHMTFDGQLHISVEGDNLLDTCVKMVIKLKERNLIL